MLKKYTLTKIKDNSYICTSIFNEFYLESYFKDLEKELIEKEFGNIVNITLDVSINNEDIDILHTTFNKNKLNYSNLVF